MKVLTISELLCLTKMELLELSRSLTNQLHELTEGSSEHQDTLATLDNVRAVLARPDRAEPRPGVANSLAP